MAKECKVYRSDNGKTFDTLYEASVEDFAALVLSKCQNEAITRQIVTGLTSPDEALDEFSKVVHEIIVNRPARVEADPPRAAPEPPCRGMTGKELEALYEQHSVSVK